MTREYFVFMCGSMAWVWEFSLEVHEIRFEYKVD